VVLDGDRFLVEVLGIFCWLAERHEACRALPFPAWMHEAAGQTLYLIPLPYSTIRTPSHVPALQQALLVLRARGVARVAVLCIPSASLIVPVRRRIRLRRYSRSRPLPLLSSLRGLSQLAAAQTTAPGPCQHHWHQHSGTLRPRLDVWT